MAFSNHLVSTIRVDRIEEILTHLAETDPEERDALADALLSTAEYSGGDISRALTAAGLEATPMQVNHYRRKKGLNK